MKTLFKFMSVAAILVLLAPLLMAGTGGIVASAATQVDTNATTTATAVTPRWTGDMLLGGSSAQYDTVWIAKGVTTNSWVKLCTYAQAGSLDAAADIAVSNSLVAVEASAIGAASNSLATATRAATNALVAGYSLSSGMTKTYTWSYLDVNTNKATNSIVFATGVATNSVP